MVAIPFPTSTAPGRRPAEGGGRIINAYVEALEDGASSQAIIRRAPGMVAFCDTLRRGFRGAVYVQPYLYIAYANVIVTVNATGEVRTVGAFNGTDRVSFARNNRQPTAQILAVSQDGTFQITPETITPLLDSSLPSLVDICGCDGYFVGATADGRMVSSGLNAITWNGLDVASAESNPDGLVAIRAFQSQLYACGTSSIEIWSNVGNPTGFPFSRAAVITRGIIGRNAITGSEDGFSKQIMFVGEDCQVYRLAGYQEVKISTPHLDWLIETDPEKASIRTWVYTVSGHPCLVVSGTGWTWVYDLQTGKWHERQSQDSREWRAAGSIYAFGHWLVGDDASTRLQKLTETAQNEDGAPLVWEVWSGQGTAYPNRLRVSRADFDFVAGVGEATGLDPIQTAPKVMIQWSDDGGNIWGQAVERSLGKQGEYLARVTVAPCGSTGPAGRMWRIRVSDPVYVGLKAGDMDVVQRIK